MVEQFAAWLMVPCSATATKLLNWRRSMTVSIPQMQSQTKKSALEEII